MTKANPFFEIRNNPIISLIFIIAILVGLFFVARSLFTLLAWASPVILIATLIINHKVVVDFLKMLVKLVKRKPLMGIVSIVLSVLAFPVVTLLLLGQALLVRKVDKLKKEHDQKVNGEFIQYEDLSEDQLILPELKKDTKEESEDYEQFF